MERFASQCVTKIRDFLLSSVHYLKFLTILETSAVTGPVKICELMSLTLKFFQAIQTVTVTTGKEFLRLEIFTTNWTFGDTRY